MTSKQPINLKWSDFGLISLTLLAFAACGLITTTFNLMGWAENSFGKIPRIEDLRGLMTSTLLLTILGMTPIALRSFFILRTNTTSNH